MKKLNVSLIVVLIAMAAQAQSAEEDFYPRAFGDDQVSRKSGQKITSITLDGSVSGSVTVTPDQSGTNYMYRPMTQTVVALTPGETVTPTVAYNANWMNAFVYIDKDDNGQFEVSDELSQSNPTPDCDLVSYSYIENEGSDSGFNMNGETVSGGRRSTLVTPAFTIPADMKPGMYRMRVKVDWGDADPQGRMTEGNDIITNGGQIVDFMLNIHADAGPLTQEGAHGFIGDSEGKALDGDSRVYYGESAAVRQTPDEGYVAGPVMIRYGYNLQGEQTLHGNRQWQEARMPAAATAADGTLLIPSKYATGGMHLISHFIAEGENATGDYPLNFDPETLMVTRADRALTALTLSSAEGMGVVTGLPSEAPFPVYFDATDQKVTFKAGEELTLSATGADVTWMYAYLYIDYDNNGYFDITEAEPVELVTQSTNPQSYASIPSFSLPSWLPEGQYRARFKTDWDCNDPGGRYGDNWPAQSETNTNFINDNRGQIIDFTLCIDNSIASSSLREETEHCVLYAADGTSSLDHRTRGLSSITFCVVPMEGYVIDGAIEVVSDAGTVSFTELPDDGLLTADISGNTLIRAHFREGSEATWTCIFNDEFNLDNVTWNEADWNTRARTTNVTWSRFNSNDAADSVAVQNNGYLSLTTKTVAPNEMRTGNLTTQNLHYFTYGRVEARCKVNPHTGNFPAFWMMPNSNKPNYSGEGSWGGWPHSGEIDIMEQINTENKAYYTIHSHWANGANEGGLNNTYQKTASSRVDMSKWHIYMLEWDKEQLRWYVDGVQTHTYDRQAEHDNDDERQWPFDRPFYVIINQSVGNGSWASNPDFNYQYRMDVDYVRVYQTKQPDAVSEASSLKTLRVNTAKGRLILTAAAETNVEVVNLSGARVFAGLVSGVKSIPLPAGVYVVAGQKVVVF